MKKTGRIIAAVVGLLLSYTLVFQTGKAMGIQPGSTADPIVSKSYVDARVKELMALINTNKGNATDTSVVANDQILQEVQLFLKNHQAKVPVYEPVQVKPGQRMIGGQGAEIILRSGKGIAIASSDGGLQDMTDGADLRNGDAVPKYHLLIISRDDGRGVLVLEEAWFIVRGEYKVLD